MTGRAGVVDACASGTGTALKASSGWRDGCPWSERPAQYGAKAAVHGRLSVWATSGVRLN